MILLHHDVREKSPAQAATCIWKVREPPQNVQPSYARTVEILGNTQR